MKILFLIFLIGFSFYSCETKNATIQYTNISINGKGLDIYEIDGCEYIGKISGGNTDVLTHKGNCKYCTKRNEDK